MELLAGSALADSTPVGMRTRASIPPLPASTAPCSHLEVRPHGAPHKRVAVHDDDCRPVGQRLQLAQQALERGAGGHGAGAILGALDLRAWSGKGWVGSQQARPAGHRKVFASAAVAGR